MNILDFIPEGKENAVSRESLVARTGMSDREVRNEIAKARQEKAILNIQGSGGGYYIPRKSEFHEIQVYRNQERKRARTILMGLRGVDRLYEDLKHERI